MAKREPSKTQRTSNGRSNVSIQDVANAAEVSIATVSRVINTPHLVSSETGERVRAVIARLGYSPNPFAKGLITKASGVLGFALPDIHGEFYSGLLHGADQKARELGYHLLVSSEARADRNADPAPAGQKALAFGFIDGLAVMITEPSATIWREARETRLPVVLMDLELHEPGVDCILPDNEPGTREACEHLLESTPPDRMYFVGGPQENFDTRKRAEVFTRCLAARGHTVAPEQIAYGHYDLAWGASWAGQHGAKNLKGCGVLAGNDEIALGILQEAQSMSLRIPEDLRIVGFDDTRLASLVAAAPISCGPASPRCACPSTRSAQRPSRLSPGASPSRMPPRSCCGCRPHWLSARAASGSDSHFAFTTNLAGASQN